MRGMMEGAERGTMGGIVVRMRIDRMRGHEKGHTRGLREKGGREGIGVRVGERVHS